MIKGSRVYDTLREHERTLEQQVLDIDRKTRTEEARLRDLESKRDQAYIELARFYLPQMDKDSVANTLDAMHLNVSRVFNKKKDRIEFLDTNLIQVTEKKRTLEDELTTLDKELRQLERENERLVGEVKTKLDTNPNYLEFRLQTEAAKEKFEKDKQRLEEVKVESKEKLVAYMQNPIFAYLVNKNFDSSQTTKGIVGKLDTVIAKGINFKEQKVNYDFLLNMPRLMEEILTQSQETLAADIAKLERIENDFENQSGLPQVIVTGRQKLNARKNLLSRIAQAQNEYEQYTAERKKLEDKRGQYWGEAIEEIKQYLKSTDISKLMQIARNTSSKEDDNLVERIGQLKAEIKICDEKYQTLLAHRTRISSQAEGIKSVSRKFTSKDYESSRSQFPENYDINSLLLDYANERITSDTLWRDIDRNQKFKPRETYSSSNYSSNNNNVSIYETSTPTYSHRREDNDVGFTFGRGNNNDSNFSSGSGISDTVSSVVDSFSSGDGF